MKRMFLGVLFMLFAIAANASTLEKGAQFKCALLTPISAITDDHTVMVCEVMGDVYSFYDKSLVIPAASRLIGKIIEGKVMFDKLVTPQGSEVWFPPSVFSSKMERLVVEITVLENLKIQ